MDRPKMIAIGIGCRKGASKEAIVALVADALARTGDQGNAARLFTAENKRHETGLIAAAHELALPLDFLSLDALRDVADRIATSSGAAERALGVPSVAEAAALAGGGLGAQLVLARITGDGVTCAIATGLEK
jgi:cobalt-precorrin 5A hydrolase